MTPYTWVLVNIPKRTKKHPVFGAFFSINISFLIIPPHPSPFQKCIGITFLYNTNVDGKCAPLFCQFFFVLFIPKNISLCRALFILLHIGTHPSNRGKELLYYSFYHEESSFYLGACPQLFNRPFFFFFKLTITLNDTTYLVFYIYTKFC